jgi:hypothetical protein
MTDRLRIAARWLGWIEVAAAPGLVCWATKYHLQDDSSMAAMMWIYSFPCAAIFFALPGYLLLRESRIAWLAQALPALLLLLLLAG